MSTGEYTKEVYKYLTAIFLEFYDRNLPSTIHTKRSFNFSVEKFKELKKKGFKNSWYYKHVFKQMPQIKTNPGRDATELFMEEDQIKSIELIPSSIIPETIMDEESESEAMDIDKVIDQHNSKAFMDNRISNNRNQPLPGFSQEPSQRLANSPVSPEVDYERGTKRKDRKNERVSSEVILKKRQKVKTTESKTVLNDNLEAVSSMAHTPTKASSDLIRASTKDKKIIRKLRFGNNSEKMLDDTLVLRYLTALKKEFPEIDGFDDPILIIANMIKPSERFRQVVGSNLSHRGTVNDINHWVAITDGKNFAADICLYDSGSKRTEIDLTLATNIKNLFNEHNKIVKVKIMKCPKQNDGYSCGYFALANLTALCYGLVPSHLNYDANKIREHFIEIVFKKKKLSMFPYEICQFPSNEVENVLYLS